MPNPKTIPKTAINKCLAGIASRAGVPFVLTPEGPAYCFHLPARKTAGFRRQDKRGADAIARRRSKGQLHPSAGASRRRNRGARKKAGEIQDIDAVGQVIGLQLHGNVFAFLMEQCGSSGGVQR